MKSLCESLLKLMTLGNSVSEYRNLSDSKKIVWGTGHYSAQNSVLRVCPPRPCTCKYKGYENSNGYNAFMYVDMRALLL